MADYKRIVSYIYEYQFGQKKDNIGYSRIESKNGQCKITIHVNTDMLNEQELKIYLFHRNRSLMEGICVGVFQMKNGTGDFRTVTDSTSIMSTGMRIDNMNGIIVGDDNNRFFGSAWDDSEIAIENFCEYDKNIAKEKEEAIIQEEVKVAELETKEEIKEETKEEIKEEIKKETKAINSSEKAEINEVVTEQKKDNIKEEVCEKCNISEDFSSQDAEEKNKYPECVKNILKNFPKLKPFPESDSENWVRIEPKDIGMLPVETWILANNSFLLHGYYNYRHLIFGILEFEERLQYVIGVPGMMYQPEQTMANMFGFSRFLSAKNEKKKDGNYGYWIQQIVL